MEEYLPFGDPSVGSFVIAVAVTPGYDGKGDIHCAGPIKLTESSHRLIDDWAGGFSESGGYVPVYCYLTDGDVTESFEVGVVRAGLEWDYDGTPESLEEMESEYRAKGVSEDVIARARREVIEAGL